MGEQNSDRDLSKKCVHDLLVSVVMCTLCVVCTLLYSSSVASCAVIELLFVVCSLYVFRFYMY